MRLFLDVKLRRSRNTTKSLRKNNFPLLRSFTSRNKRVFSWNYYILGIVGNSDICDLWFTTAEILPRLFHGALVLLVVVSLWVNHMDMVIMSPGPWGIKILIYHLSPNLVKYDHAIFEGEGPIFKILKVVYPPYPPWEPIYGSNPFSKRMENDT